MVYLVHPFFFPIRLIIYTLFFSISPSCNSDRGPHIKSPPPVPVGVRAFHVTARILQYSSLIISRRMVPAYARRSQKLIPFSLSSFDKCSQTLITAKFEIQDQHY